MATLFRNGRVFIGDGRVFENGSVLVEGDKIAKVSENGITVPEGTKTVDLEGATLLPGFIDAHIHFSLSGDPDPNAELMQSTVPTVTLNTAERARKTLLAGVTSIRDMGGWQGVDLSLRDAVAKGIIPGPRMLVSGQVICMTGGHGWTMGREADGPDDVRKAAREQIKSGADIVKLMATGGVMTPGVEPGAAQFTEEELRAGIEEAHKAGRRTATHAQGSQGILNALKAGIDSIEHGFYFTEEIVSIMIERSVPMIPTISALFHIVRNGVEAGIPAYAVEKANRVKEAHLESIKLAKKSGVAVAMGTDAGTPFNMHGANLWEAKLLVEQAGFSTMDALRAGTEISAKVLGWEDRLGTIEEGKYADLVVVKGNPLEDIDLLIDQDSFTTIMKGGEVVKAPKGF